MTSNLDRFQYTGPVVSPPSRLPPSHFVLRWTGCRYGGTSGLTLHGGDLASTGVRDRGTRVEAHVLVNPVEKQRNCERRLRSRCLKTSERLPEEGLWLWSNRHLAG